MVQGIAAFWEAPALDSARERVARFDREALVLPLVTAAAESPASGTLQAAASDEDRLTRRDRKSTRLNSSHVALSRMPSSA